MNFTRIEFNEKALFEYSELFTACFPNSNRFIPKYLAWLYLQNPDGYAFGFDAREHGVLAAHYVCIPVQARIEGRVVRVLLSLNTATHPRFQGQGLFTKLAAMTYTAAAEAGFEGIYGVANANSTPGFVKRLGFQLVRPLDALIGVGMTNTGNNLAGPNAFERFWTPETLEWRCASPFNPVLRGLNGKTCQFHARAVGPWIHAYAELVLAKNFEPVVSGLPPSPLKLYLGLVPDEVKRSRAYVSIPQRFRPSPLNFIYRSLVSPDIQIDKSRVSFSFLDFDAY